MNRDYGRDPYGNYYEETFLIFPVDNEDNRIHPKDVIFGIEVNGEYAAYREVDLISNSNFKDVVGGVELDITRNKAGDIDIINTQTGEQIVKERDFWFAWYTFHPNTKLYEVKGQ